ncbi:hypothetical protein ACQ4PT_013149 [Festuca glaucescens]
METVLGAILNTIAPKAFDLIKDARVNRYEVKEDIDYIKEELNLMSCRIQEPELRRISTSRQVSQVVNRAGRLVQDTEDCIYRFFHRTRLHCGVTDMEFASKIKILKERLTELKNDVSSLEQGSTTSSTEPEDPHFAKEDLLVGMDVPSQELVELLERTPTPSASGTKGKLKVISIVGFGGSGKTRLAKKVCEETGEQFDLKAWVHMGLERNVQEVLKEIVRNIGAGASTSVQHINNGAEASIGVQHINNGSGSSNRVQHVHAGASTNVAERLKSSLCNQRYLIVIDDVRRIEDWQFLERVFPDSDVCSRIIVTTTSQPVAARCSFPNGHVYKMSTLCSQDSDNLFFTALTRQHSDPEKEQLSTLMNICDGLPLALIEAAESLKGQAVEKFGCQETVRGLCALEEGNNVKLRRMQWVLMNKYSGLTSYGTRSCLLYFHMFPSRYPTKRKFLIRRWLAEEFVERGQPGFSDLDAASEHLKTLSDCNIIRGMQLSNNATVKSCRLHGTMHEFISRQSKSQNFVNFLCHGNDVPAQPKEAVRRLSLRDGTANSESCIEDVPLYLLRTLAVSGETCKAVMDFSKYELLRVLDLKEWDHHQLREKELKKKCRDMCKLFMLKYLGLPGSIREVPKEIQDLIHLETLDVGETEIVEVYREVIKVPKLKHLLGKFRLNAKYSAENWVLEDSRLETFSGFVNNGKAEFPKLMKHMKKLKKVKIWCDSKAEVAELKHVSTAIHDFIFQKSTDPLDVVRSLSIDVKGCKVQFLGYLNSPGRLTKLKLNGSLEKVPDFITPQRETVDTSTTTWNKFTTPLKVTSLCLSSTTLCGRRSLFPFELQPGATLLPSLRYLKLVEDDLGPLKIQEKHFPGLERICLAGSNSINLVTIEAGALQHIASLHVICEHLVGLAGIQIGGLKMLKEIALDSKVSETTKDAWKVAARGHPNKPQILFIETATKP